MTQNTEIHPFTSALLRWYDEHGRDLPWRHTTDPYQIWLSEVILQQTRIQQGQAYWERFVRRWPSVDALAAATEDEVLREWQGLGYYSRARNLHHAAQEIVKKGKFPDTLEDVKSLKGVGDYTAAAIGSIAFGWDVAVVDGNVYRVLSRYFGIDTPINTTEGKKLFTELAQSLLPVGEASRFNQAMMDFGAIQCSPKTPLCMLCPLQDSCAALREGLVESLPVKNKALKVKQRRMSYFYVRCNGFTAIHRRGGGDIWQGLWEPYLEENLTMPKEGRLTLLRQNVRHVLTHRIILADFYLWETEKRPALPEGYIWVEETELQGFAVPRLIEILMESLS